MNSSILYLELGMGAAGDMLTAALYELLDDEKKIEFLDTMNNAGIPGVKFTPKASSKCGISGTYMEVTVDGVSEGDETHHEHEHHHDMHRHEHEHHMHEHHHEHEHEHHIHRSLEDINSIISSLKVPEKVRKNASSVYNIIAEAESRAHSRPVSEVHFHEVGSMDAIADVTSVSLLFEMIGAKTIVSTPVTVGFGKVRCAHGIMPVPAPATADILKGIPICPGSIEGELCTPTGAALIKHFVRNFDGMPSFAADRIGYGMGKKDFEAPNCVRAMLGKKCGADERVAEISCNIDDMTAEAIAFATEMLLENGALDVCTVTAGMKKSRQGTILKVMCAPEEKEKFVRLIFAHTSTIGVRAAVLERYVMTRSSRSVEGPFGKARVKTSEGYGAKRVKPEYDDVCAIARDKRLSYDEAARLINRGYDES